MPDALQGLALALTLAMNGGPPQGTEPAFDFEEPRFPGATPSDVELRNVTFLGASGKEVEATLVIPSSTGRHPGVLFVHWYDDSAQNSNRTQFLPDALRLARSGVRSLLVDTMWSDPKWFSTRNPDDDKKNSVAQVKDLRRGLDVLLGLDSVDSAHVALVGHDFGAMYGSLAAGVDKRVKAMVFIAGTAHLADWYLLGRKLEPAAKEKVREELQALDPLRYLPRLGGAPVLFQFATKDPYVTAEAASALVASAQEPKSVRFYECGHAMNQEAADERVGWLLETLGLATPKP